MHDPRIPDSSSESSNSLEQLCELLSLLLEHYQQAERLEEELAELIKKEKFDDVAENTRQKAEVMARTVEADKQITALAQTHQAEDGSFPDGKSEKMRLQAIALLERLQELETQNYAALDSFRDSRLKNFRQAKQAKRAAHGYKQTKSIYRSKHDTRR